MVGVTRMNQSCQAFTKYSKVLTCCAIVSLLLWFLLANTTFDKPIQVPKLYVVSNIDRQFKSAATTIRISSGAFPTETSLKVDHRGGNQSQLWTTSAKQVKQKKKPMRTSSVFLTKTIYKVEEGRGNHSQPWPTMDKQVEATTTIMRNSSAFPTKTPFKDKHGGVNHSQPWTTMDKFVMAATTKVRPSSMLPPDATFKTDYGRGNRNQRLDYIGLFNTYPFLEYLIKPVYSSKERATLMNLVSIIDEVCTSSNITYFIYWGTLLGSYRHHDLIPWDDDFDVSVKESQREELLSKLADYSPEYQLEPQGSWMKYFWRKSEKVGNHPWKWPFIDISFFLQNDTHIWDKATGPHSKYIYPIPIVFPLHKRPLSDMHLYSPHDSFQFLKITYGSLNCESSTYCHKHARDTIGRITFPCRWLKNIFGFVYRSPAKGGINETLKIGEKVINSEIVAEPSYAITKPFTYEL